MSNHESELKLQAYLDGELSAQEAAEVKVWLSGNADGQALLAELQNTKAVMAGAEGELKLPESREFFWSKVQREIERQERTPAPAGTISWVAWLRHHLVSVGGAALLTCVLAVTMLHGMGGGPMSEMEMSADEMGAYTFRDEAERMTVVWLYDKSDDSEFTEPAAIASMDPE